MKLSPVLACFAAFVALTPVAAQEPGHGAERVRFEINYVQGDPTSRLLRRADLTRGPNLLLVKESQGRLDVGAVLNAAWRADLAFRTSLWVEPGDRVHLLDMDLLEEGSELLVEAMSESDGRRRRPPRDLLLRAAREILRERRPSDDLLGTLLIAREDTTGWRELPDRSGRLYVRRFVDGSPTGAPAPPMGLAMVSSATVSKLKASGKPWDLLQGAPDPQIVLLGMPKVEGMHQEAPIWYLGSTGVCRDTLTPRWGSRLLVTDLPAGAELWVVVRDADVVDHDTIAIMGYEVMPDRSLRQLEATGSSAYHRVRQWAGRPRGLVAGLQVKLSPAETGK